MGSGLSGGLYFTFSTFIMTTLARIGRASGGAAMNAINATILQSLFMPISSRPMRGRLRGCPASTG